MRCLCLRSGYSELEPDYSIVWKIRFCQNDTTVIFRSIADKVTLFLKMIVSYFIKKAFRNVETNLPMVYEN